MRVDDAFDVRPRQIDRAVDDDAGIDRFVFRRLDQGAVRNIDLEQVRSGDLVEHQARRIDQHLIGGPRHPRGIVRQHEIVPAEMRDQPIAGGEIDPHRPLLGADMARARRKSGLQCIHDLLPRNRR